MDRISEMTNLGLILTKKLKAKLTGNFPPYLRAVKPLFDTSKRANLNLKFENDIHCQAEISKMEIAKSNEGIYDTHSALLNDKDLRQQKELLKNKLKHQLNAKQMALISCLDELPALSRLAFSQKGYELTELNPYQFIVHLNNASAFVQLATGLSDDNTDDNTWNECSIAQLAQHRIAHKCDAAIYLTPGKTSKLLRQLEKNNDLFIFCGWDVVQLFEETEYPMAAAA